MLADLERRREMYFETKLSGYLTVWAYKDLERLALGHFRHQ
ncbi:hypothetical protein MY3296_007860 [Beauveria thailandica]